MIVLDSYAVIALLRGERAVDEVATLLRGADSAVLTPLGVAEVVDRVVRLSAVEADQAVLDLAELGLADPEPVTPIVAFAPGLLRAIRYHRSRCAVSLADCVVIEVAREHDAAVATSDPHLLDGCTAEGIEVLVLPNTHGDRWSPT